MTKHFQHNVRFDTGTGFVTKVMTAFPTHFSEVKQLEKLAIQLQAPKQLNTWSEIFTDIEIQLN